MSDTTERTSVKDIVIVILAGLLCTTWLMSTHDSKVRVYDCGMAEWHPDIPSKVKEECRKLRKGPAT